MSKSLAPTAATVREYFRADSKRMESLSPEAQHTVENGARGRLHPDAIKRFNKGRKPGRQYVLGATKASVDARHADRAAAAKAGVPVGQRGPLSKAAKQALAQVKE